MDSFTTINIPTNFETGGGSGNAYGLRCLMNRNARAFSSQSPRPLPALLPRLL
ncbi:hypothetical protein CC2G_010950 [Coprinopsis cinerea AmutBmut pab1-1]|nr:hypothetical protein CC2G_010950 [Coprinopsis cinerea AmutBmut pab1-1]